MIDRYIRKIIRYIFDADYRFCIDSYYGKYHDMDDKEFLKRKYRAILKKELNIDNPQTFNEKMQWLKIYNRNPEYTDLVDKYKVKEVVGNRIGTQYIIPTIGIWDSFEDIEFDKLPNQFVLKCTHDSDGIVVVTNKDEIDLKKIKKKMVSSLRREYYYTHREWPYKNVKPKIIAEELLVDSDNKEINDYKLMCFNGKVKCSFVCTDRMNGKGLKVTFFDREWKKMPFERHYQSSDENIQRPKNYELMIELAEKLSENIPFVRVDFYEVNNKVYFGEMTFFPGSGFEEFQPEEWDRTLGNWISLPKEQNVKVRNE